MFDDIDLNIGEVLPSGSLDADKLGPPLTFATQCSDICTCTSRCCQGSGNCC